MDTNTILAVADKVRIAMKALEVPATDATRVYELARLAVAHTEAGHLTVWTIAALIVPDCLQIPTEGFCSER